MLLAWVLATCLRLIGTQRPVAVGVAIASLVVLPDAAMSLWVNTLYPEFTAVTALIAAFVYLLAMPPDATRSGHTSSISNRLESNPRASLTLVIAPALVVCAGVAWAAMRRRVVRTVWTSAWLACAVIWSQLFVTALGDGVHDLSRQAFLVYGTVLFWAVATVAGGVVAFVRKWPLRRLRSRGTSTVERTLAPD